MLLNSAASAAAVEGPAIDLTPIIDMVFNLLIFFLIASSFQQVEREMQVALPHARASGPLSVAMREIVINVTADGQAIVSAKPVSDADLDALLRDAVAVNPEQKVNVRGDRAAAYGDVARVLDICKHAGIGEPFLQTIPVQ